MKKESIFKRERPLFHFGPVRVSFSPLPFVFLGWLMTCLLLLLVSRAHSLFAASGGPDLGFWDEEHILLYFVIGAGVLFMIRVRVDGKLGFFLSTALYACFPLAAYVMVEFANSQNPFGRPAEYIFMNVIFMAVIYLIFLVIFGSYRWSALLGTGLLYIFALACYFVLLFRGTPFVPLDIFAAGTATNVAENYVFEITEQLVIASVWTGLMLGVGYQLGRANLVRVRWKLSLRAVALVLIVGIVTVFFGQNYLNEKGYAITYWDQKSSYSEYGNMMAFCLNLRNVFPERPDGYDAKKVAGIVDDTLEKDGIDPDGKEAYNMITGKKDYKATETKPNIIMIMNESFADLQSMGDFETNAKVLPFFNSLKENTVRGTLQCSTHGGGTACTEYEALTGNAQRFLQAGTVAYSASMRDSTPSMAWALRAQGYTADAFHPYYASGWSREKAYAYMGFERFIALEDYVSPDVFALSPEERIKKMEEIFDPKDGNVYNRDYMSDHYDYKLVEILQKEQETTNPYFMFNVTIQNHGGYTESFDNFQEKVHITSMKGDYPQADRFLSLMRASDDAFKELVTYYKEKVKEPTVIVMFGDHPPALDQGFYEELFGADPAGFNVYQAQKYYQTPFVIWANYDIPEKDMGVLSANYLSPLIMQTAGLELTDYERYLASLYHQLPVISTMGFVDGRGKVSYTVPEMDPDKQTLLQDYQCVAYNNLLDPKHRDWSLFTLDGQSLPEVEPLKHE